jgi:hypothetical protein
MKYTEREVEKFFRRTLQKTRWDAVNRRNLEFDIDTDYIVELFFNQKGKCALTGWEMKLERGGDYFGNKNPKVASMDRLDNSKGYVKGNIQLACSYPNNFKGRLPNQVFLQFCKDVADTNFPNE